MRNLIQRENVTVLCRRIRQTANLMVGLPDYDNYLRHVRMANPGKPAMTKSEFVAERMARRYEGKGAGRCC
jgi:uncharacterized short protein YbdD (DUF466 family)